LYFLGNEILLLTQTGLGCVGPFLLSIQKGLGCVCPFLLLIQTGVGCVGPFLLLIQKGLGYEDPFLLPIQKGLDCVGSMSYMNVVLTSKMPAWPEIENLWSGLGKIFCNCLLLFSWKAAS
jgi:hypothetical protein